MLIKAKTLKGYKLKCTDGEIGEVKDFIFDEQYWTIRYIVANTGTWLTDRQVLISPYSLVSIDKEEKQIVTTLTVKQIENSPPLYVNVPITRQYEATYNSHYGLPTYWNGPYMWGANPAIFANSTAYKEALGEKNLEAGLRSSADIERYKISAPDTDFGHVVDFIIDEDFWAIRYLIIDTISWWPSPHVLIAPSWIDRIGEGDAKIYVSASSETIKSAPEYDNETEINRAYEVSLNAHYGCKNYWECQTGEKAQTTKED